MVLDDAHLDTQTLIGARLRATRDALGLTQEALAKSIGVGRTAYTNWEAGRNLPDPLAIGRMCTRHGITLDWIFLGKMAGLPRSLADLIEQELSRP